ncbi:MAG: hypothetical protein HPY44_11110 [Armatimonadetes bacterium]|nr:hypothetical protein [Armatimonadota bacterium]
MAQPIATGRKNTAGWIFVLAALVAYLRFRVEPHQGFEAGPDFPPFATTATFLWRILALPGGPAEYIGAFLAQLYRWQWAAILLIAALTTLLALLTNALVKGLSGRSPGWVAGLPALAYLGLVVRFSTNLFGVVALLIALAAGVLLVRTGSRPPARRLATALLLSVVVCVLTGGMFAIFAAVAALLEWRRGGRLGGLLWLLAAEALPYAWGVLVLDFAPEVAFRPLYMRLMVRDPLESALQILLYASVPALAVLWCIGTGGAPAIARTRSGLSAVAGPVLLALLLVGTGEVCMDRREYNSLQIASRASASDFEGLLRVAKSLSPEDYTLGICTHINRALFETGQLPDAMFSYPQASEGLLLGMVCGPWLAPGQVRDMRQMAAFQIGDIYLRLGLVSQVEHMMHESLEQWGEHAAVLRLLTMANLAKGRSDTARHFLHALTHNLSRRAWAKGILERMEHDPNLDKDRMIQVLRQVRQTRDAPDVELSLESHCLSLLDANPANPAAFEYLMAVYLLNRQLDKVAENIGRLDAVGFAKIPRHYQEAILLYESQTGEKVDLHGRSLDPEIVRQFELFTQAARNVQSGLGTVSAAQVAKAFGNTYFHYFVFGRSGVGEQ